MFSKVRSEKRGGRGNTYFNSVKISSFHLFPYRCDPSPSCLCIQHQFATSKKSTISNSGAQASVPHLLPLQGAQPFDQAKRKRTDWGLSGIKAKKACADRDFLTREELLLKPFFACVYNVQVSPEQRLTGQQGKAVREKDTSAPLPAAPLPFLILSRKGFLLPVNGDIGGLQWRALGLLSGANTSPGSPSAGTSRCTRGGQEVAMGSGPACMEGGVSPAQLLGDFPSWSLASFLLQTPHPNVEIRPLCLQSRCLRLGDDQEGTSKTLHSRVPSHSHFC